MKSWKTTLSGVLGAVTVLAAAIKLAVDGHIADVNAVQVLEAIGGLALAFGLINARDKDVTSEQQGLIPPKGTA